MTDREHVNMAPGWLQEPQPGSNIEPATLEDAVRQLELVWLTLEAGAPLLPAGDERNEAVSHALGLLARVILVLERRVLETDLP